MYTLISQDEFRRCEGTVGMQPAHNFWTTKPYLGNCIKEYHDVATDTWIESATAEEIEQVEKQRYNELDIEYTKKISDLVEKHVQKYIIDGTPIPQEIIDERQRLKDEFYQLTNKQLKK